VPDATFESALRVSTLDVLETMFFVGDAGEAPPAADPSDPAGNGLTARLAACLTFEGSPSGWLALHIDQVAARRIAADFLGEEEEAVTDRQAEDIVCELANMICGSMLSLTESETVFHLSSPVLVPAEEWTEPEDAMVHRVALTNGTLVIFMKT
jgi:CheY-specific phosphatase CheX